MAVAVASAIMYSLTLFSSPDTASPYNYITLVVIYLVSGAYLALTISMLLSSSYTVDDKYFTLNWGILKSRLEIKSMTRVILDDTRHTLTVFYNDDNYFVVRSATIPFPELVQSLREVNDKIVFDFATDDKKDV